MIDISSTAVAEINRMKLNRHIPDSYLRLSVKTGGCLDFFYDLEFDDTIKEVTDNALSATGDLLLEVKGVTLVVDAQSWKYIEHLKLHYSEDLMGGGFRFNHPQIKNNCGCGISFAEFA